jgi:hypothetical protein
MRCICSVCLMAAGSCRSLSNKRKKENAMSTDDVSSNPEDFSYCGIDCDSCDVLKATLHGDQEARMRAAKLFEKTAREHWGMEKLDPMTLSCEGCRSGCEQHSGYGRCPMRPCAQKRGLSSCGLCPEWEQCGRLAGLLADAPEARANLQRIADGSNH